VVREGEKQAGNIFQSDEIVQCTKTSVETRQEAAIRLRVFSIFFMFCRIKPRTRCLFFPKELLIV